MFFEALTNILFDIPLNPPSKWDIGVYTYFDG